MTRSGAASGPEDGGYAYLVEDHSFLSPWLKRWIWEPVEAWLPARLSANDITLLGSLCTVVSFAVVAGRVSSASLLLAAVGCFFYLHLDCIDGMRARRTGTASPLGELVDHWFDSLHQGLLAWTALLAFAVPPEAALALFTMSYLGFFSVFWEQYDTGVAYFPALGSVEGLLILCGVFAGAGLIGPEQLLVPVVGMFTAADLVVGLGIAGYAIPVAATIWRRGLRSLRMSGAWAHLLLGALWGWRSGLPMPVVLSTLTLLGWLMCGRLIIARVTGGRFTSFDPVASGGLALALALAFTAPAPAVASVTYLWIAAMVLRSLLDFVGTTRLLREFLRPGEALARVIG